MDLRILPTGAMTALTAPWLHEQIEQFRSIPEIAGLEATVKTAHEQLVAVQGANLADAARGEISAKQFDLDQEHDTLVRTIWNRLGAEMDWHKTIVPKGGEKHDTLARIRDRLLPEGLSWTLRSYLEESGNAIKAIQSLTKADEAVLSDISVGNENLLDTIRRWGKVADELGDLERRKVMLTDVQTDTPGEYDARLAWVRAVNAVLYMLDFAPAGAPAVETLRKPVLEAVAAQEQRRAASESRQAGAEASASSPDTSGEDAGTTE